MKEPKYIVPPAIVAPAPDRLAAAVHAQAAKPGCQNPNGSAWWTFDGATLIPAETRRRYRTWDEEVGAYAADLRKSEREIRRGESDSGTAAAVTKSPGVRLEVGSEVESVPAKKSILRALFGKRDRSRRLRGGGGS